MPKKKPAPAPPPAVVPPPVPADRVEQTVKWILAGEREFDVIAAAVAQWPDQNVPQLLGAVAEYFRQLAHINDTDVIRGWCFAAVQEIYRKALENNQPFVALQAVKRLMEISGA